MSPDVVKVVSNDDYTLTITFENEEVKKFDVKPYLNKGIFKELQNLVYFKTVKVIGGTVSWNDRQDFCPDTVYLESIPI